VTKSAEATTPQAGPAIAEVAYQRIATEEAWAPPELLRLYRDLLDRGAVDDPGFASLWGFYLSSDSPRWRQIVERLQDLGERRLGDMDATGIDKQVVGLTAPGVQVLDTATARSLAALANDQLADAVRRHPDRFAGLAAVAPQHPTAAAAELERAVTELGLKGLIVNGHTQGEYLDDTKFWPIFEAAEALDVPIYLHPAGPPPSMIGPFVESGLDGAIYGFAVDNGLHLLRLMVRGVFDRFPRLRVVVGHMGEGLPFWLYRIDYMHQAAQRANRHPHLRTSERTPSEYMRENVYVTTSGVAWEPAIMFTHSVLGPDRVLYAMDYPYQYVAHEVRTTDAVPMSDEHKKMLFQSNAERVFSL
jgi:5-carboxyvanillate decarboxylase